jgi:hypothetical protein
MEEAARDRMQRAARNQSLWRDINELALANRRDSSTFKAFVCECAAETCTEEVSLTLEEYEAVRKRSDRFFVKPGHVVGDVEIIADAAGDGRYQVVEKLGLAAQVSAERDPRDDS